MSSSSAPRITTITTLSEQIVQDAFHGYLKSSLTQAKLERLLDADVLSSAEGDLMISGPALCLYFAALRSTTNPPSVPLPRSNKSSSTHTPSEPIDLSASNCPPAFRPFLNVWALTVPLIQSLTPQHQHDLARVICNLPPVAQPLNPRLYGIAAELRGVALEISQRRSFQDRYASDLQAALDSGSGGHDGGSNGIRKKASFVPPPVYDAVPPPEPPTKDEARMRHSTASSLSAPGTKSPSSSRPVSASGSASGSGASTRSPSPSPVWDKNRALPPRPLTFSKKPSSPPLLSPSHSHSHPRSRSTSPHQIPLPRTPSRDPTILTPVSPTIEFIRETLYAALGDVLEEYPTLRGLLQTDPPRAYFASVSLAILFVSTQAVDHINQAIIGVLGTPLPISQCPDALKPFMIELISIGAQAKAVEEEDDQHAMECVRRGREAPSETKMERVRKILLEGIGYEARRIEEQGSTRRSLEGRAVGFANRVGELALKMTGLPAFRERQDMVFKVLAGIGDA